MRTSKFLRMISAAAVFLSFAGCEKQPTEFEDYTPQPMLSAFLYDGVPVDSVLLQRVAPLYSYYSLQDHGIAGAEIRIFPLDDPESHDTLHLIHAGSGVYRPASGENLIPRGKRHYRIEARKADEGLYLWAETVVPDSFSLLVNGQPPGDTLGVYTREDPNLFFQWTPSDSAGGYIFLAVCLTPVDSLLPLDPDYDPEEEELEEEPGRAFVFPLISSQLGSSVPWISFEWVGWHRVELQACNYEYYRYVFSLMRIEQGAMNMPEYNVQGGLGVFAGLHRIRFYLYMAQAE